MQEEKIDSPVEYLWLDKHEDNHTNMYLMAGVG